MAELILNEAQAEQNLAEPSDESNVKYELSGELIKELRRNTYCGRVKEDVVGHICKILEILDLIKIADMNEGDGKINTWEELVKQFFSKFYPLSCASNYDKMCDDDDEGRDPLEFITWRNSNFKDHKKVDEMTKRALLYSWIEVENNEGLMDEDISSDNDRDHTNLSMIAKPELKIGDEFLKILRDNSFNGMDGSDVTDHIAKVLEITEWIKIPNVDKDELRLHVFSKSLSGEAEKWWNREGRATTWKELGDKFFHKYYPLSHTYKSKILDDLDHETDYFEFLYWLASKFDNYWELDKNIKSGLWEFYVNGRTNGMIDDLVKYNESSEENNKKTCSDLFFKPYLDAQDGKDIYEIID
ncbi:hypothetical protein Tco_1298923 [Tanacetum coccineum]